MPHVSGGDLGANDEVKVFKEEGEEENEKRSSENLAEDKNCLMVIAESEGRDEYRVPGVCPRDIYFDEIFVLGKVLF
ncbi:unnamed protein product [Notodromas monacha]|uniref:CTNNB1 binding N-teminal domain-containing protein n=1 Tax=Notodromas monacha TaxID=399045 RepID=A0A7R9GBS4_9CRUS|nr:unnamed protein product [Notodromas monacha]CAG0916833.1 unnamed protein product [Notodromas monacha]